MSGPESGDAWKARFLDVLRTWPNVRAACREAGVGRATAYRAREADPAFAEAWIGAIEDAYDRFEGEAARRALQGSTAVRTHEEYDPDGRLVRRIVETTEGPETRTLLAFLAAGRPEKWRANYDLRRLAEAFAPPCGRPEETPGT